MKMLTIQETVAIRWLMKAAFQAGKECPNSQLSDHLIGNEYAELYYQIVDGRADDKLLEAASEQEVEAINHERKQENSVCRS